MSRTIVLLLKMGFAIAGVVAAVDHVTTGESCKVDPAKIRVNKLVIAVDCFIIDTGRLPRELDELVQSDNHDWDGPYAKPSDFVVPTEGPIVYRALGGPHLDFELTSLGADRAAGGTDRNADYTVRRDVWSRGFGGSPLPQTGGAALAERSVQGRLALQPERRDQ